MSQHTENPQTEASRPGFAGPRRVPGQPDVVTLPHVGFPKILDTGKSPDRDPLAQRIADCLITPLAEKLVKKLVERLIPELTTAIADHAESGLSNPGNHAAPGHTTTEKPGHTTCERWPEMMSMKTLSAYLDLSQSTLQDWDQRGRIPEPQRNGARCTRWHKRDIDAWIEQRQPPRQAFKPPAPNQ